MYTKLEVINQGALAMSDQQLAENTIRTKADQALQAAWRRFLDYDAAAGKQRDHHTRVRTWIIVLGLMASTLAVISSYRNNAFFLALAKPENSGPVLSASVNFFWEALHVILIFVPIIIAGLLTYAYQFAPSLSWVAYRIGAELVRREIYLYRMQAGDYAGKNALDEQQTLLERLNEANKRVNKIGAPDPYLQTTNNDIPSAVVGKTDSKADDGFSPLTAEQYITYRVLPQKDWYIKKSQSDYANMRRWRVFGLAATAGSSAVAALGVEPIVAVTTALGTALATYMELKMYGRTFNIYHPLANQIEIELNKWSILSPAQQSDPALMGNFVKTAEDLFQSEREQWMQQAIQSQQAIEQTLGKSAGGSQSAASSAALAQPDTSNQTTVTASILSQAEALTSIVSIQTPAQPASASDSTPSSQIGVSVVATTANATPDNGSVISTTAQPVPDAASNGNTTPANAASSDTAAVSAPDPTVVTGSNGATIPAANGGTDPAATPASNGSNGATADVSVAPHPADHGDGSAG